VEYLFVTAMDSLEKKIEQFWDERTTAEQRQEILRQLEASGTGWKDILQQHYNKVLAGEETSDLSVGQKDKVWQNLREQVLEERDGRGHVILFRWMAAACVLLIITLGIFRWNRTPVVQPLSAGQTAVAKFVVEKNTGTGEENLTLPDHSLVVLTAGSTIRYQEHFDAHARNIALEGKALFEVAKDSVRPFTVTARGFATTALGTRFIVDATRPLISIRLLKGKIVVNATADAGMALKKIYLTPGQELRINTEKSSFDVKRGELHEKAHTDSDTTTLSFERISLANVFLRLSAYYKTTILFDKAEVQGLSFTGAFEPTDELDMALKVICNMNQLTFTKENDRIVISKNQ